MTRVQDLALGAGVAVLLTAVVAMAVEAVREVLEVERHRRERRAPLTAPASSVAGGEQMGRGASAAEGVTPRATSAPPAASDPVDRLDAIAGAAGLYDPGEAQRLTGDLMRQYGAEFGWAGYVDDEIARSARRVVEGL